MEQSKMDNPEKNWQHRGHNPKTNKAKTQHSMCSASKHNKHMIEHFRKTEGGMSSSSILFLCNTFLPIFFNKLLKTCTRFTTTIKIMHMHTMLHVISFNIHIETLLSKLSISNMTRVQSLKKIIEWDNISKCLFGADFAKCKKIITNC